MTTENQHRLLRRQLKKANLSADQYDQLLPFLSAVNQAYFSADKDVEHLEHVLEVNSKELYKANTALRQENLEISKDVQQAKNQLTKVVNNVTDIIIELDKNGNFIYLNPAWEKFAEESVEDSIGKSYMDFASEIVSFDQSINKQIIKREFSDFKTVFSRTNKKGELKWWELSTKLIKTEDGGIDGAIASIIDVTSLKETEEKLIVANRSKSSFLSTMSHEIRTPLNAVIAISNILLMENPLPNQLENLKTLKYSSKHLLHLINDILDYNKLISGNLRFDNSSFSLENDLDHLMKTMDLSAKKNNVKLILDKKQCVPKYVKGDGHRLSQVLTNLMSNAIKFTGGGEVTMKATCLSKSDEKIKVRFEVVDTGIGIAEDKLEYIFERFTQAELDTSKKFGGTGLGLAICKKILEKQGSEILVESTLGKGTRFYFDLEFEPSEERPALELKLEDETKFDLNGTRILVVDDNRINLMVIQQFFKKWNVEYFEASDGQEAIDIATKQDLDIILMDLQMPVKDGYEATAEIRSWGGFFDFLPIIALSASVSTEVTDRVYDAGMNDYLSKPFDPVVLYQKIEHFTELFQLEKARTLVEM